MNEDIRQAWIEYDAAVVPWLCDRSKITGKIVSVPLKKVYGIDIPTEILDKLLDSFCELAKIDIAEMIKYRKDPTNCTDNTFTWNYMHSLDTLDKPAINILLKNRVEHLEELTQMFDESIKEINHPKYC
jgi:hypothetical protein